MELPISNQKIVDAYFRAWHKYDLSLLNKLFDTNACYVIRNKKTYAGIEEIKNYWVRNKERQRDLETSYRITDTKENFVRLNFKANFFDVEESEQQQIVGEMEMILAFGRITKLEEGYSKTNK